MKFTLPKNELNTSLKDKLKMNYIKSVENVNAYTIQNYNVGLYCVILSIMQSVTFLLAITAWNLYNITNNNDNNPTQNILNTVNNQPISTTDSTSSSTTNNTTLVASAWYNLIIFTFSLEHLSISFYVAYTIAVVYIIMLMINFITTIFINDTTIYKLFAFFGYFHRHIAYFMVHYTIMKGIFANVDQNIYYQPYSSTHMIFITIGIFIAIFNIILAMLTNNLYFTTQRMDRLARFHSSESSWILRNQAIIGILIHLPYGVWYIKMLIAIITIICCIIRLFWLIKYCIYSDFTIAKLKSCGCVIEIMSSLLIIFSLIYNAADYITSSLIIGLIVCILSCIIIINLVEWSWNNTLAKDVNDLKNELEALQQFYGYQSLTQNSIGRAMKLGPKHTRRIFMNGIMNNHYLNCMNNECHCKYTEYVMTREMPESELYEKFSLHFTKDPTTIINFSRYLLEEYLKKFPTSLLIKIHCIQYYLESLSLYHRGYMMIKNLYIIKNQLPFYILIVLHELESIFHIKVQGETIVVLKQGLDIMNMIIFSELENEFMAMLERQVINIQKFWSEFLKTDILMKGLFDLGVEIFSNNARIEKHWEVLARLIKKRVKFPYLIYGIYMAICNNATIMAEDLVNTYRRIFDAYIILEKDPLLTQYTLFSSENMYFVCSADIEKPGIIYLCSENVLEETGFARDDLIGKSINTIIPPIYAKDHDRYMLDYIETGKQTVFHATRKIFYFHRDASITPCYLHMKPSHHHEHGMVFLGVVKPFRSNSEYILTDENGQIDCSTSGICKSLLLNRQSAYTCKNSHNITIFNPKFKLINQAFTHFTRNPNDYELRKMIEGAKDLTKSALNDGAKLIFNDYDSDFAIYEAFKTGIDLILTVPKNVISASSPSEKLRRMFSLTPHIKHVYTVKINDHFFRGNEIVRVIELLKVENDNLAIHFFNSPRHHLRSKNRNGSKKKVKSIISPDKVIKAEIKEESNDKSNDKINRDLLKLKRIDINNNNILNEIILEDDNEEELMPQNKSKKKISFGEEINDKELKFDNHDKYDGDFNSIISQNNQNNNSNNSNNDENKNEIGSKKLKNFHNQYTFNQVNADNKDNNDINETYVDEEFHTYDNQHQNPYNFYQQYSNHSLAKLYINSSINKANHTNTDFITSNSYCLDHNGEVHHAHHNNANHNSSHNDDITIEDIHEPYNNNNNQSLSKSGSNSPSSPTPHDLSDFSSDFDYYNSQPYKNTNDIDVKQITPVKANDSKFQVKLNLYNKENLCISGTAANDLPPRRLSSECSLIVNDDEGDTERKKIKKVSFSQLVGQAIIHGIDPGKKVTKINKRGKKKVDLMMTKKIEILKNINDNGGWNTERRMSRILKAQDKNKDRVKLFAIDDGDNIAQSIGGNTLFGMRRVEQTIEKAVNSPFMHESIKYILWFFIFFVLLNIILGLANYAVDNTQVNQINAEMESIYYSYKQLDDFLEINRRTRTISFLETDYISETRHSNINITNYFDYNLKKLYDATVSLKDTSTAMRAFLFTSIQSSYRNQIANQIISLYWNSSSSSVTNGEYDIFKAIQIFIGESINIVGDGLSGHVLDLSNLHVSFILNNTYKSYLSSMAKGSEIFKNAVLDSLNSIGVIEYIISIIGICALIIYYCLYYIQHYRIYKQKSYILKLLATINPQNIKLMISRISIIKEFILKKKENIDLIDLFIHKKRYFENLLNANKVNAKKGKFSNLNFKGFHHVFHLSMAKMIVAVILVLWYYILKSILFDIFQNDCKIVTKQITNTYASLYNQGLALSLIYELLSINNNSNANDTISNILGMLNGALKKNADLQDFIGNFGEDVTNDNNIKEDILSLLSDDICYLYDDNLKSTCKLYCDGASTRGILGMNTYIERTLSNIRDNYISSNITIDSNKNLISNIELIQLEAMFYLFMRPSYILLLNKLNDVFETQENNIKIKAILLFIIFAIITIIIFFTILLPLYYHIKQENQIHKQFLKLIPTNILMTNKRFIKYLEYSSPEYLNLTKLIQIID